MKTTCQARARLDRRGGVLVALAIPAHAQPAVRPRAATLSSPIARIAVALLREGTAPRARMAGDRQRDSIAAAAIEGVPGA